MDRIINILIVDDEQIVIDSIKRHLRHEKDYSLFAALNVADALEIIKSEPINIILTDLMMPDIDGLEFIEIVSKINKHILMIMITGYATINTALQAMQVGAFDYIAKPFTKGELKKVVFRAGQLLDSQNGDDSAKKEHVSEIVDGVIKSIGKYTWMMKLEDGSVLIGVERPFIINLGNIQSVYLPSEGDKVRQGSSCFQAFCSDLSSETLLSPLTGFVKEINNNVVLDPNKTLQDPYGNGWLLRIDPSNFDEEVKQLGL
jgi:YesN/AraC family two-component response regulator